MISTGTRRIPPALVFSITLLIVTLCVGNCENICGYARSAGASLDGTLGAIIYRKALHIFNQAEVVHYEHHKAEATDQVVLSGDTCQAECDCSGFVSYVVRAVAPHHFESIESFIANGSHPLAKTFVQFFATLSPTQVQGGWIKIMSYTELRQGDLIAWEKAANANSAVQPKKGNTGHVMIVEAPATRPESMHRRDEVIRYVSVPVIDSSSVDHFPPEELPPRAHQLHRDGLGRGSIRLILNDEGQVVGYWEGTYWGEGDKKITRPSYTDSVSFARLMHIRKHLPEGGTNEAGASDSDNGKAEHDVTEGADLK